MGGGICRQGRMREESRREHGLEKMRVREGGATRHIQRAARHAERAEPGQDMVATLQAREGERGCAIVPVIGRQ